MAGYIRKTHAGGAYTEARSVKRWLLSDGFQVRYSKSPSGTQTGKFDLRNVEELRMVSRGDAPGVRVKVRDRGNKLLEIHFLTSGPRWIEYWASAVAESALDDELRQWRRAEMTAQLDSTYADQAGLKAKGAGTTDDLLFSPRERAGAAEASQPPPRAVAPLNHSTAESTASTAEGVPAAADGDDDDDVFIVTVPPLSKPGDKLRATDQYGSRMILVVPPGEKEEGGAGGREGERHHEGRVEEGPRDRLETPPRDVPAHLPPDPSSRAPLQAPARAPPSSTSSPRQPLRGRLLPPPPPPPRMPPARRRQAAAVARRRAAARPTETAPPRCLATTTTRRGRRAGWGVLWQSACRAACRPTGAGRESTRMRWRGESTRPLPDWCVAGGESVAGGASLEVCRPTLCAGEFGGGVAQGGAGEGPDRGLRRRDPELRLGGGQAAGPLTAGLRRASRAREWSAEE